MKARPKEDTYNNTKSTLRKCKESSKDFNILSMNSKKKGKISSTR